MRKLNLQDALATFSDHWNPRVVAELNGQHVKIAKISGEFIWHSHENEDELFLVVRGQMDLEFRDQSVRLSEGELMVVPRGVEHRPVARGECHILLFEPASTVNTGNTTSPLTRTELERL